MVRLKDYTGEVYRNFEVVKDLGTRFHTEHSKERCHHVIAKCNLCYLESEAHIENFINGNKRCKCQFLKNKRGPKFKDYSGEIYGKFIITEDLGLKKSSGLTKQRYVIGKCISCNKKYESCIKTFKRNFRRCSCTRKKSIFNWTRISHIHTGMISRCHNEKNKDYIKYGSKGIKVCSLWRHSKENFYKWAMENGYSKELTIDRINSKKGYSPKNCRWITLSENSRFTNRATPSNKIKKIKKLLDNGYKRMEICKKIKVSYDVVRFIDKGFRWTNINY